MAKSRPTRKRFRRFSVRTLVILVTILCAYLGSWEMTKRVSVPHVDSIAKYFHTTPSSPCPFLVRVPCHKTAIIVNGEITLRGDPLFWDYYLCFGRSATKLTPDKTFR